MVSKVAVTFVMAFALATVAPLLGTCFGAVTGWLIGLCFDDTLAKLAHWVGLDARPWEMGAMLGFVSGFFRATSSTSTKAEA